MLKFLVRVEGVYHGGISRCIYRNFWEDFGGCLFRIINWLKDRFLLYFDKLISYFLLNVIVELIDFWEVLFGIRLYFLHVFTMITFLIIKIYSRRVIKIVTFVGFYFVFGKNSDI